MTIIIKRLLLTAALSVGVAACAADVDPVTPDDDEMPGDGDGTGDENPTDDVEPEPGSSASEDNTFDHDDVAPDVWELLDRMQEQGPPEYASRVHSCPKMRYDTIGRFLASRGVDLASDVDLSAGRMWRESQQALGAANYEARARESTELTTASASKLFDIFVQAAPEIIANMPSIEACTVGGAPTSMFNESGQCTPDGIACLLGVPPQGAHIELCNSIISKASDPETGKTIAVAALLAAGHTCE